jgi:hypothetical protein
MSGISIDPPTFNNWKNRPTYQTTVLGHQTTAVQEHREERKPAGSRMALWRLLQTAERSENHSRAQQL